MALSVERQLQYWGGGLVLLALVLFFLGSALTPFIVGAVLAYVLDPLADRLEAAGLSRVLATIIITLSALIFFFAVVILLVPFLSQQAQALAERVPVMVETLRTYLTRQFPQIMEPDGIAGSALAELREKIATSGATLANALLTSTLAVFDFLLIMVVAPVVAFYLLLDWDKLIARIDDLIPRDHQETIRHLASEIDRVLNSFLRGQIMVMGFLATFYSIGLIIIGVDFGVFVGIFAGLVSFIPYVGTILGGALALGLAFFQFWGEWWMIAAVLGVFVIGQFVEGNVLTPILVGESVGLHPVWLMVALSGFGVLFGFAGLLVAVPLAACIGVLIRFGIEQYKRGRLYQGQMALAAEATPALNSRSPDTE